MSEMCVPEIDEKLRQISSATNEWLRFAEGKNAALLVSNSASIFALLRLLEKPDDVPRPTEICLCVTVFLLACSALLCLISFIPKVELEWLLSKEQPSDDHNLLFYSHIAVYSATEYLSKIRQLFGAEGTHSDIERCYAEQIVVNARIAVKKYQFFTTAVRVTLAAITPLLVLVGIHISSHYAS